MIFFCNRCNRNINRKFYTKKVLERFKEETDEGSQLYEKIVQLKFEASDGKKYATDCLNTEDLLRLIQSIPSPKAEPFKQWLAKTEKDKNFLDNKCNSLDRQIDKIVYHLYSLTPEEKEIVKKATA